MRRILQIAAVFIFLLGVAGAYSDIPRAAITGTLVDASTEEPLWYANVFLSRTSWGAATDEEGRFVIPNVPLGDYELVVSYVGYEMETLKITLSSLDGVDVHLRLNPVPYEAPELTVTARVPKKWERDYRHFKDLFLGTSENAKHCTIRNKEVINFEFDEENETFRALAQEPLEIENRALGYTVYYILEDFAAVGDRLVRYLGKTRFEPMEPKSLRVLKRWERNRRDAYYGSSRHFLTTLIDGSFTENGFVAYNASSIAESNTAEEIYFNTIQPSEIIVDGDHPFERKMSFDNYIKVYFSTEDYDTQKGYTVLYKSSLAGAATIQDRMFAQFLARGKLSAMMLNTDTLTFNLLGYVYNPYHITFYGHWGLQRLADELPLDYSP